MKNNEKKEITGQRCRRIEGGRGKLRQNKERTKSGEKCSNTKKAKIIGQKGSIYD